MSYTAIHHMMPISVKFYEILTKTVEDIHITNLDSQTKVPTANFYQI